MLIQEAFEGPTKTGNKLDKIVNSSLGNPALGSALTINIHGSNVKKLPRKNVATHEKDTELRVTRQIDLKLKTIGKKLD